MKEIIVSAVNTGEDRPGGVATPPDGASNPQLFNVLELDAAIWNKNNEKEGESPWHHPCMHAIQPDGYRSSTMAFLDWNPSLDTGIDIIDSQHRRIVDYINQLHDAQEKGDRDQVGDVIEELVDYTISHFAFEESLMENAGYPYLAPHQKVHALFVRKVEKFVERFGAGEEVTEELLGMLQKWLINHIKNEDGDYVESVQRNNHKIQRGWLGRTLQRVFG